MTEYGGQDDNGVVVRRRQTKTRVASAVNRNTSLGFLIRSKKNTIYVDDPSAYTEQKTTTTATVNNLLGGAGKNTQKTTVDLQQKISNWRTIVVTLPSLSLCGREWALSCGSVVRVGSGLKCV